MSGVSESGVETTLYHYNNANQLVAEQLGTSEISGIAQEKTYCYDRRGNLTAINQGEELLKQFTFDTANRMSQSAGNVDGIWKQAVYQYNGLGQRMGQEICNLLYVLEAHGWNMAETPRQYMAGTTGQLAVLPQNPAQSIRYTLDFTKQYHNLLHLGDIQNRKDQTFYWDGNVVSMQEESGEESFYLQDDLGSPMELLDAEGEIREAYAFDEFGVPLVVQSGFIQNFGNEDGILPVPNALQQQHEQLQPFGFTGYQTDVAGGLYFAQARRYDAGIGRFVSEDKVRDFADAPFTLNPYSYCWNKPMELVDLNGLYPVAGVTAEVGEDLNGQTHPGGPTAGATSAIDDALSGRNEYSGNTSSYDNESENVSSLWEYNEYYSEYGLCNSYWSWRKYWGRSGNRI